MTVRPFEVAVPQARLDAIRARVEHGWIGYAPDDDADWKYGTDAAYLEEFRRYWLDSYDWRQAEAELNRFPQFVARVDDHDVHFYHVKGSGTNPFPVILTHGWPGSVVEFLDVIDRLANPGNHGGDPEQGLTVVVPSLPGYGFSSRPARPIGPMRTAALWRKLMAEVLGYSRFGAQGGDWGAGVSLALGRDHADVVAAIHLNLIIGLPLPGGDAETQAWQAERAQFRARESAYADIQATRPQTIALALADSPLGFAGWVLEKCRAWSDCRGDLDRRFGKDRLLTNIMTYLVNDAVGSAIWMYHGSRAETPPQRRVEVPTGFAAFPAEPFTPPPRRAVQAALNIVRWNELPAGGHFAAWEEPELFAGEVRSFFAEWR